MLASEVLVLNRLYLPVRVTTVRRAFCLMFSGKARAILPDYATHDFASWLSRGDGQGDTIGLRRGRIAVPRVIVLSGYCGVPRHEVRFSRRNVFVRDGHRCQYCATVRTARELNLDHVLPLSRGGQSTWENVVCCCLACNRRKADRAPEAAGMRLLRKPRKPRWHPLHEAGHRARTPDDWRHFVDPAILEWSPDGTRSVGATEAGAL